MGIVSLERKVWSIKCGVQSAQCRGKFKGVPSVPEWTFGSVGRSNAVSGERLGRQEDLRNMTMELGQGSMQCIQCQVRKG